MSLTVASHSCTFQRGGKFSTADLCMQHSVCRESTQVALSQGRAHQEPPMLQ